MAQQQSSWSSAWPVLQGTGEPPTPRLRPAGEQHPDAEHDHAGRGRSRDPHTLGDTEADFESGSGKGDAQARSGPKPAAPKLTVAQENAKGTAEDHLAYAGFSKKGLIKQLDFEGYEAKDIDAALATMKVDWNAEAAETAQAYVDMSHFSRSGLIKQLRFGGYTSKQAADGADSAGLWPLYARMDVAHGTHVTVGASGVLTAPLSHCVEFACGRVKFAYFLESSRARCARFSRAMMPDRIGCCQ